MNSSPVCVLGLLLLTLPWAVAGPAGKEFFVSPNGDDAAAGTQSRPFRTLEHARDAVRRLKQVSGVPHGGVSIFLRAGKYELTHSFTLTAEDSGSENAPIRYRAWGNERVTLTGGRAITNLGPLTDPEALRRISPVYHAYIRQADLRALGITDFGKITPRGFRVFHPAGLELFFDGKPMTLARWPNAGDYVRVSRLPVGEAAKIKSISSQGSESGAFFYSGARPSRWASDPGIWVHGYWRYDWADDYAHIRDLDTKTQLITLDRSPGNYGIAAGQRYYYLNVLEELDTPGEWYLDRKHGLLFFWPPAKDGSAEVSLVEGPLIDVRGASDISIEKLILENGRGDGVDIEDGVRVRVAGCTLRNLGNWGAVVQSGADSGVISGDIYATGAGGIRITGGDRKTLTAARNYAVNNHIHDFARWVFTYRPAILLDGVGIRVAHNLIHDAPHTAILIHGNDNVIEYNNIHDVVTETNDAGAFYIGRSYTERGNIVRYNYFHHIGRPDQDARGVYLDDCSSGTTVFGNIFWRVRQAVILGGGRDNHIENNVFVESEPAIKMDDRCMTSNPVWQGMVRGELKQGIDAIRPEWDLYLRHYPDLASIEQYYARGSGVPPEGNVIARNIAVGASWVNSGIVIPADRALIHFERNLIETDPLFISLQRQNFQLQPDSPAWRSGFEKIPVDKIGLYSDEYRIKLPPRESYP